MKLYFPNSRPEKQSVSTKLNNFNYPSTSSAPTFHTNKPSMPTNSAPCFAVNNFNEETAYIIQYLTNANAETIKKIKHFFVLKRLNIATTKSKGLP